MNQSAIAVRCMRCHRILKSEASKKLGYGITCAKKMGINDKTYIKLFELRSEVKNENNGNA